MEGTYCTTAAKIGQKFCEIINVFGNFWGVNLKIFEPTVAIFFKMGQPRPLFLLFLVFSNKHHYNFYNKYM